MLGTKHTIQFPSSVKFRDLCRFSREVDCLTPSEKILFLTGHVKTFTPTSMVMIAKTCRHRSRRKLDSVVSYSGLNNHTYANNLGFADALRLKGKPYPQGAFGGQTYLPMSSLERSDLEAVAWAQNVDFGDAIEYECRKMARVVSQQVSPELEDILAVSFREIFRNVFEHAEVDRASYCAQYWPSRGEVEICISDRGIGIPASLQQESRYAELTDRSALLMSLMPGVSSKARAHAKRRPEHRSAWDNFGVGLFLSHRLFGKFGWFGLASGTRALLIEGGNAPLQFPALIEGSVVSLRLRLSDVAAIRREIREIRQLALDVKARLGVRNLTVASAEAFLNKGF